MNCPVCGKPVALYRHKDGVHPKCRASLDSIQLAETGGGADRTWTIDLGSARAIQRMTQASRDLILRRINKPKD